MSTEAEFLETVGEHRLKVTLDDGVHRHLRFKRPHTITYWFDIVTWPGYLCISGDMGCYVFSRVNDMFEFFRKDPQYPSYVYEKDAWPINPWYWGEKLQAVGENAGYTEFDEETFRARVKEHFDQWCEWRGPSRDFVSLLWSEIERGVLSRADEGEHAAYEAVNDFCLGNFRFEDFFDGGGCERFTHHYLWCVRAIVWGIGQYDQRQNAETGR